MSDYLVRLFADIGSVLGMLAILLAILYLARRVRPSAQPAVPGLAAGWVMIALTAAVALIFRAIVLGQLLAGS